MSCNWGGCPCSPHRSSIQPHQYCASQLIGVDTTTKITSTIPPMPSVRATELKMLPQCLCIHSCPSSASSILCFVLAHTLLHDLVSQLNKRGEKAIFEKPSMITSQANSFKKITCISQLSSNTSIQSENGLDLLALKIRFPLIIFILQNLNKEISSSNCLLPQVTEVCLWIIFSPTLKSI